MMNNAVSPTQILSLLNKAVFSNTDSNKIALVCLLAKGHILIEDVPGVGKTTLAKALCSLFGLQSKRVQFTNDILPSDIIGTSIFQQQNHNFRFKKGAIFTHVLLADELNRANPKTQSALLEAMEESQVTVEGKSLALPQPFFVIATQNPIDQSGTFPLPDSQLDRFLCKISLGYPSAEKEKAILQNPKSRSLKSQLNTEQLSTLYEKVNQVHVSETVVDYLYQILHLTRSSGYFRCGLSPRAGISWLKAAKALAAIEDRDHVLPDDIRYLTPFITDHRLHLHTDSFENTQLALKGICESISII